MFKIKLVKKLEEEYVGKYIVGPSKSHQPWKIGKDIFICWNNDNNKIEILSYGLSNIPELMKTNNYKIIEEDDERIHPKLREYV